MSKNRNVLVTNRLPAAVEARLDAEFSPRRSPNGGSMTREEILEGARETPCLLISPAVRFDRELILALPENVKAMATVSVGFDHIDLEAARERGLIVTNTPDVLTDSTADIALVLMLSAARRTGEAERQVRAGKWGGYTPASSIMGVEVSGKKLGIYGMGRIGQALATRARALNMEIHYAGRRRLPPEQEKGALYHPDLSSFLGEVDFLSLHCPSTAETYHWLDAAKIAQMKPTAIVINTARGAVLDDAALIAALKEGRLYAAGLDVFENEPNINPGYLELENVVLLPHIGSATTETRNAIGFRALDNLAAVFAGQEPLDRIA